MRSPVNELQAALHLIMSLGDNGHNVSIRTPGDEMPAGVLTLKAHWSTFLSFGTSPGRVCGRVSAWWHSGACLHHTSVG